MTSTKRLRAKKNKCLGLRGPLPRENHLFFLAGIKKRTRQIGASTENCWQSRDSTRVGTHYHVLQNKLPELGTSL